MANSFKKNIWTQHSQLKIKQYGLSKQKLLGILYGPERKEQGIAPGTTAVMKTNKSFSKNKEQNPFSHKNFAWQKKASGEIWIMYKDTKDTRKIISAWRYPGISKPGEEIPIPKEIRRELLKNHDF